MNGVWFPARVQARHIEMVTTDQMALMYASALGSVACLVRLRDGPGIRSEAHHEGQEQQKSTIRT